MNKSTIAKTQKLKGKRYVLVTGKYAEDKFFNESDIDAAETEMMRYIPGTAYVSHIDEYILSTSA